MPYSIPIRQEIIFSPAPFFLLFALGLWFLPSSTRHFPFQHLLLHALPLCQRAAKHTGNWMNDIKAHWAGKQNYVPDTENFHRIWLDMPLGWDSVNISFGSSISSSGLQHSPPPPQPCPHCSLPPLGPFLSHPGCAVGKETAPEKGSGWLCTTQP